MKCPRQYSKDPAVAQNRENQTKPNHIDHKLNPSIKRTHPCFRLLSEKSDSLISHAHTMALTRTARMVECGASLSRYGSSRNLNGGLIDKSADDAFARMTVGLDLVKLEQLVCTTIPNATGNRTGSHFRGLASRCCHNKTAEEIEQVLFWLQDVVRDDSSIRLPTQALRDIHCYIGLIYKWHGQREASLKALVSAAWLAQGV
jgi:hypothetical protein